jgi:hypothetical protein
MMSCVREQAERIITALNTRLARTHLVAPFVVVRPMYMGSTCSVFDADVVGANAWDKPLANTVMRGPETNKCGSVMSTLSNSLGMSTNPATDYYFNAFE